MATGSSAGASINASAQTIAQMRTDMAAIAASAHQFSSSMGQASGTGGRGGGGGGGGGGAGGTGSGPGMGMSLGQITGAGIAKGLGALVVGGINDLRVGAPDALAYEYDRYRARMGTGDFTRFNDNMNSAMNSFNVQDRAVFQQHMGASLSMGAAARFSTAPGGVGERMAAQNVGALQSLAALGGMSPQSAMNVEAQLASPQSAYSAMAMGVMTFDPSTGNAIPVEGIASQYFNTFGLRGQSLEQFQRNFGMGKMGRISLEKAHGTETAQAIITAMQVQLESGGKPLEAGSLEARTKKAGAPGQEMRGTEYTEGMDTTADTNRSQQEVIQKFADDTINGIVTANGHLQAIYDWMTTSGEGLFNMINTAGGYLDTMNLRLPSATGAVSGLVSGMLGGLGGLVGGMLSGGGGGNGTGGGGGGGGNGCCCCDCDDGDTDLPGGKKPGGKKPGGKGPGGKPPGGGLGRLAPLARFGLPALGLLAGGYSIYDTIDNSVGGIQGEQRNENIDKGDFATTVGTRTAGFAAGGAAIGTFFGPGPGTLAGGGIGALVGLIAGTVEATIRESKDNDQIESRFSEGSWFIEKDQNAKLHYGEMVVPNRIAEAVRTELRGGSIGSVHGVNGGRTNVIINLTVQKASDNEAMLFAQRVKKYIEQDDELMSVGSGNLGRVS